MHKLLAAALLFLSLTAGAQDQDVPEEARPFILPGYRVMDYKTGDLNSDGRPDAVLILSSLQEDSVTDDSPDRPLLLLVRQPNGKLKQERRNDHIVMCRQCGGAFGDPYDNMEISGNGFTLSFYGGSSWRWGYRYTFKYKPAKKDWLLVSESQSSFQSGDPENTMKDFTIGEEELGEISIADYTDPYPASTSQWKVRAAKTYFYDNPKQGSTPRKGYLLKGDTITGMRELKNFAEVSFANKKGQYTYGFVLKKDLIKVK